MYLHSNNLFSRLIYHLVNEFGTLDFWKIHEVILVGYMYVPKQNPLKKYFQ